MQLSPGWKLSTQSAPKLPQTEFLRLLVKHGAHGVRSSRKTKILYDKIHCLLLQIFVIINKDFSRFARWKSKKMGLLETHMICCISNRIVKLVILHLSNLCSYVYNLLSIFITYLLRPRKTVCFVDQRPLLLPEAKPRATTAVEGPQNTLLSRGLSK